MNPDSSDLDPRSLDDAVETARAGQPDAAVASILDRLASAPPHEQHRVSAAQALARIGRMAEGQGNLTCAGRALVEALKLAPRFADLHLHQACILLAAQQRRAARRALETALSINPGYVAAQVELALLDAREGLLAESLDALRRLAREHPIEEPRLFRQGLESLEHADWDDADALLKQALKLPDPGLEGVVGQATTLMKQGRRAEAMAVLREALCHHESYPDLHSLLGSWEMDAGHLDDALASFARALELQPDHHAARVRFASALEALGEPVQAAEQVALVLERDPAHPQALQIHERLSRRGGRRAGRAAQPS